MSKRQALMGGRLSLHQQLLGQAPGYLTFGFLPWLHFSRVKERFV